MNDPQDKILDAFLDEMLNDRRPARSAGDILRHVQAQLGESGSQANPADSGMEDVFAVPAPTSASAKTAAEVQPRSVATRQPGKRFDLVSIASLAAVLIAAVSIGVVLINRGGDNNENLADEATVDKGNDQSRQPKLQNPDADNRLADDRNRQPIENRQPASPEQVTPADIVNVDVPENPDAPVYPESFQRRATVSVAARSAQEMAQAINEHLQADWSRLQIQPASTLEPRSWVNRLASRLIGRGITAEEMPRLEPILAQSESLQDIRQELIDFFVQSAEYQQEFSDYWGQVLAWEILGISPSMRTSDADMIQTRDWLRDQLSQRTAIDQVAYDLLSAVGSTSPESPEFNPASSYLVGLGKRFGDMKLSTAHVADSFLGMDNRCLQCHDHFGQESLADSKQRRFYEFHAFFAQTSIKPDDEAGRSYQVANQNFLPQGRQGIVEAPIQYADLDGTEHEAFPAIGDFRIGTNGFVARVDRRTELAKQIAASAAFRETMVDHVWASMLNLPLSGIDGEIDESMAELRSEIGEQFAANDYDLRWLVRAIASSDAFAVGVGSEDQIAGNNPFLGATPRFNVFYSRIENRRSAVQSLQIVAQAYSSGDVQAALSAGLLARVDSSIAAVKPDFVQPFIPTKDSEWATSPVISRQLDMIAASTRLNDEQKIQHIVQAALGRMASDQEIEQAKIIIEKSDEPRTALQDVWWSLLNSVDYQIPPGIR